MSSLKITAPLITLIVQQSTEYTHATKHVQHQAVTQAKSDCQQQQSRKAASVALNCHMTSGMQWRAG